MIKSRFTPLLISRISTFVIFLALIRCIAEPLRLQYYSDALLTMEMIRPFIIGALAAASGLLIMTILSILQHYKSVTVVAVITIAGLVFIKAAYDIDHLTTAT